MQGPTLAAAWRAASTAAQGSLLRDVLRWVCLCVGGRIPGSGVGFQPATAASQPRLVRPVALRHPLQLARLLALSHGEAGLTRERWLAVRAMEAARGARLAAPQAVRA